MNQAILWLAQPMKVGGATDVEVIAANVEDVGEMTAAVVHSAGRITVSVSHSLVADDVTPHLWLVSDLASFSDVRGQ